MTNVRFASILVLLLPATLLGVASAFGPKAGPSVNQFTVDAGGGTSTGGNFELSGTAGQPDAGGELSGGTFAVVGGFWPGAITPAPECFADITGNSTVDIDDLLAVISAWGACPAPPTACDADIAPPGGNGSVNIDDLLVVINGWGACP